MDPSSSTPIQTESKFTSFPEWCSCWKNGDMYNGTLDCCNSRKCHYCDSRYCLLTNPGIFQTCQECQQYYGLTKPMYLKIKTQEYRLAQMEQNMIAISNTVSNLSQIVDKQREDLERLKRSPIAEANILNL